MVMKQEIPWIDGTVRYVDEDENVVDFEGQFSWNPAAQVVMLVDGEDVRIFPDGRLFEVRVKKEDFENLLMEALSSSGEGVKGYS